MDQNLHVNVTSISFFQFPFGRKEHCDIHWHAVSYEENPDLYGGKVNKFPGIHVIRISHVSLEIRGTFVDYNVHDNFKI